MKLLSSITIVSVLFLSACTLTQRQDAVAAAEAVYTIDATVAAQYKNGELGIAPDSAIVADMQQASKLAKERIDTLRTAAQNGDPISVSEILLTNDAVNVLTVFLENHGVLKASDVTILDTSSK